MGTEEPREAPNLVRCEITGQMVPEDEVIEIQGHRVSAAGKEELLRRLRSGESMPGEMERPSVLRRFGCIFVDGLLLGVMGVLIHLFLTGTPVFTPRAANLQSMLADEAVASALGILVGLAYFTYFHGLRGQTPGKMAGKLRVVSLDGSAISYGKALVRALCYTGPQLLAPVTFFLILDSPDTAKGFQVLVGIYAIVNVLCALFDRSQQRALHDRLAGTRVIKLD